MHSEHKHSDIAPSKVVVRIKTDDLTLKEEFLVYDCHSTSYDDPVINTLVDSTLKKYAGILVDPDITITSKITWVKDGL